MATTRAGPFYNFATGDQAMYPSWNLTLYSTQPSTYIGQKQQGLQDNILQPLLFLANVCATALVTSPNAVG